MRSDSPFDESRTVPSSTRDARRPVSTHSRTIPGAWFGIAVSLAALSSLKSFTCAWIIWNQCSLDVPHNVIPSECNPALADPPGLWVIIPFRFGTSYWTAIGQSTCSSVFGATGPINETSVGNDDLNKPFTSLAVWAKWLVILRHARFMRCLRESLKGAARNPKDR